MIRQDIDVGGYWTIKIVYKANLGEKNTGFTYTDSKKKTSIVGISATSSRGELLNTIVHEAKHVQSDICAYYDVDESSEEAAYLIGYIVQNMYKVFRYMISTGV